MADNKEDVKLNLEVVGEKGLSSFVSQLQAASKNIDSVTAKSGKLKQLLDQLNKSNADFQKTNGTSANRSAKTLASGGVNANITNAAVTGELKKFEAQLSQIFARLTNNFAKGAQSVVKANENYRVLQLSQTRQSRPASSLDRLADQRSAQQIRMATLDNSRLQAGGKWAKGQQSEYMKEVYALNQIEAAIAKIKATEKARRDEEKKLTAQALADKRKEQKQIEQQQLNQTPRVVRPVDIGSLFRVQAEIALNSILLQNMFGVVQNGIQTIIEYDREMYNLAAITQTTDQDMKGLNETFLSLASSTRFSSVEIAKAATTMGQAGFSSRQINESIGAVVELATATGTDLTTSVDVATSALTVFNLSAGEMSHVADVMTGALNLSKLTMDKLALGIQYAGNTASEAGVTLEEFTAALGAVANAGIKSGSTLGTGFRQLATEFENPSKKLTKELQKLGLSVYDIDIKSQSLSGVMHNLKEAGFSSANAFAALDLRAAAFYVALSKNLPAMESMERSFVLTNAATEANKKQMEGFANTIDRFKNTAGSLMVTFAEPFKKVFGGALNLISDILSQLRQMPKLLAAIGAVITTAFGTVMLGSLIKISSYMIKLAVGTRAATVATTALAAETVVLSKATTLLARTPWALVISGVASIGIALYGLATNADAASDSIDGMQSALDKSKGDFDDATTKAANLDSELSRLTDRYGKLSKGGRELDAEIFKARVRFGQFDEQLANGTVKTFKDLIEALKRVQDEYKRTAQEANRSSAIQLAAMTKQKAIDAQKEFNSDFQIKNRFNTRTGQRVSAVRGKGDFAYADKAQPLMAELANTSVSSLNTSGLQAYANKILDLQSIFDVEIKRLDDKKEKAFKAGKEKEVIAYEKEIENIDRFKSKFNDIGISAQELLTNKQLGLVSAIENSGPFKIIKDQVDASHEEIKKLQLDLQNAGQDTELQKTLKEKLEKAKKTLNDFFVNSADTKAQIVDDVVQQTGEDYVSVTESVDAYTKEVVNGTTAEADAAIQTVSVDLADNLKDAFDKYSEMIKLSMIEVERKIKRVLDESQKKVSEIDAVIAGNSNINSAGYGKYSDAEVTMMNKKKEEIQNQALEKQLSLYKELAPELDKMVAHQEELKAKAQDAYENGGKSDAGLKSLIETTRDYNDAVDKQADLALKAAEASAKLRVAKGEEVQAHASVSEQVKSTLDNYKNQLDVQADLGASIEADITSTLDVARNSFTEYSTAVMNGTMTVSQAFKQMAIDVLKAMQEIAMKKLAASLFSMALGSFGAGSTSYSAPIGPTQTANSSGFFGLNNGGSVRKFAGGGNVVGSAIKTRDAVPALLRDGEFVLRNSAVDLIGRDKLEAINAMGNRKISEGTSAISGQATSNQAPTVATPVNVYLMMPQPQPPLTDRDVLAIVTDDMMKNGQTKKLIKSVMVG